MKETMKMARKMEKENSHGKTGLVTKEILKIMILMAKELTKGQIKEFILVNGSKTKCTGKEFLLGPTVELMKGNIKMIKKRVMEYSLGQIRDIIKVVGKMEDNMVKVYI